MLQINKTIQITLIILIASVVSNAQINVLVSKTQTAVEQYLDSLNQLKGNRTDKIQRSVTNSGDLMLINKFSQEDEDFYACSMVATVFYRQNGTEYCASQIITGHSRYAQTYLSYIKDNFKPLGIGKWETSFPGYDYKVHASFEAAGDKNDLFTVKFELQPVK